MCVCFFVACHSGSFAAVVIISARCRVMFEHARAFCVLFFGDFVMFDFVVARMRDIFVYFFRFFWTFFLLSALHFPREHVASLAT